MNHELNVFTMPLNLDERINTQQTSKLSDLSILLLPLLTNYIQLDLILYKNMCTKTL
jgi:hypothetical protein